MDRCTCLCSNLRFVTKELERRKGTTEGRKGRRKREGEIGRGEKERVEVGAGHYCQVANFLVYSSNGIAVPLLFMFIMFFKPVDSKDPHVP